jgi:hypothetical protein
VSAARQMREFLSLLLSCFLLTTALVAITPINAAAMTTLTTCTDLVTQKTIILKANQKTCRPLHATAIWRIQQSDSSAHSGAGYASLRTCTSKRTQFDYQLLKSKCAKYQNTNDYWRTVAPLEIPIITTINARGYDSAAFALAATTQNIDAPIAYYLITNIKTGQINKVSPNNAGELSLSNLSPLTSYTFIIAAVSVDGTSLPSSITPVITTGAVPVVVVTPAAAPLAAPAFTLSSSSETKTVNNVIAGYTIDASAGGTIASYSISPAAPAGLTFSTSTGLLSGTPTSVAVATTYTIIGTNSTGSASQIFTLTTTRDLIGTTGPGGGTVFYASDAGFRCGNLFSETGSAIGGLCHYLEVAPSGWSGSVSDPYVNWSGNTTSSTGLTGQAIGQGFANTEAMIQQVGGGNETGTAGVVARGYSTLVSGATFLDWYLPSQLELLELYKYKAAGSISGFASDQYWSSSERNDRWAYWVNFSAGGNSHKFKYYQGYIRPIRAF